MFDRYSYNIIDPGFYWVARGEPSWWTTTEQLYKTFFLSRKEASLPTVTTFDQCFRKFTV